MQLPRVASAACPRVLASGVRLDHRQPPRKLRRREPEGPAEGAREVRGVGEAGAMGGVAEGFPSSELGAGIVEPEPHDVALRAHPDLAAEHVAKAARRKTDRTSQLAQGAPRLRLRPQAFQRFRYAGIEARRWQRVVSFVR